MILNKTPVRTARNFNINDIELDIDLKNKINDFNSTVISGDVSDFDISEDAKKVPLVFGVGKELENQIYKNANKKIKIVTKNSNKHIIKVDFNFNDKNINLIDNIEFFAMPNSETTIVIKYMGTKADKEYFHNGIFRITAMENAKVNAIIVNMLNCNSYNFISMENTVQNNSVLNYNIIDFGGKTSISNYFADLIGEFAVNNLNTIYLGTDKQIFDINYIVEVKGKESEANIEVQGALKDFAKKSFKGTIDFKKGCKKAKGSENEFCILLSDTARSKALPMLLCTEEDVEGSHSSAAGKVENDMLFYIMSRGISYKEALKLIVKARFNEILENIQDERLKEFVVQNIDKRLD